MISCLACADDQRPNEAWYECGKLSRQYYVLTALGVNDLGGEEKYSWKIAACLIVARAKRKLKREYRLPAGIALLYILNLSEMRISAIIRFSWVKIDDKNIKYETRRNNKWATSRANAISWLICKQYNRTSRMQRNQQPNDENIKGENTNVIALRPASANIMRWVWRTYAEARRQNFTC